MLFQPTAYPKVEMNQTEFTRLTAKMLEIEEFKNLTDKMFRCLVLFADYKSPFRQKPKEDRFKLAALEAGYSIDSHHQNQLEKRARELIAGDNKYWNAAYKRYMEMQHDEDREVLSMVDQQIDNIRKMLQTPTEDEKLLQTRSKLLGDLPGLIETKRNLSRIMGKEEEFMGNVQEEKQQERSLVDEFNEELQRDNDL